MSNKTENLYNLIFKSIIWIVIQNNLYDLDIQSITTDIEIALINAVNNNFKMQREYNFILNKIWYIKQKFMVY